MKITITIDTSNDAFNADPRGETTRLLTQAVRRIFPYNAPAINLALTDPGSGSLPLLDSNGNTCGTVRVEA